MTQPTAQQYQNAIFAWGDASPILHRLLTQAVGLIERAEAAERQIAAAHAEITAILSDSATYHQMEIPLIQRDRLNDVLALLDAQPSKQEAS